MEKYLHKLEKNPYGEIYWNVPEQKQGTLAIVGGNVQNFRAAVKVAEYAGREFPLKEVRLILPDALRTKLPPVENFNFLSSTEAGSLASEQEIREALDRADGGLIIGDLSKNSITGRAVASACVSSANRGGALVITRDTVDLIAEHGAEGALMNEKAIFLATMAQLIKVWRAVYYPRVLTLSQPLLKVAEALHKFTLSYPAEIITLCDGQVAIAKDGEVYIMPLEKAGFSPITLWSGELATKIATLTIYNPGKSLKASIAGALSE